MTRMWFPCTHALPVRRTLPRALNRPALRLRSPLAVVLLGSGCWMPAVSLVRPPPRCNQAASNAKVSEESARKRESVCVCLHHLSFRAHPHHSLCVGASRRSSIWDPPVVKSLQGTEVVVQWAAPPDSQPISGYRVSVQTRDADAW